MLNLQSSFTLHRDGCSRLTEAQDSACRLILKWADHGPFDCDKTVKEGAENLSKVLTKVHSDKTIQFEQDIRSGLRMPWDDGDTLEVLGNLMDNACKYGGHRVRVSGRIQGGQIRVAVEDDGPGIAPENRPTALREGGRLDEAVPGTGLGLAICADIVEAYEGALTLEDSELGGLLARVSLPLARQEPQAAPRIDA